MRRQGLAILQLAVVFAMLACTSSNTPTGAQTNQSYDANYREATRSAGNYGAADASQLTASGDPPLTIMYIATETGDLYPGEDYYIYAVVDKPKDRENMEYSWSVANGTISEIPEVERGRLQKLVEDGYATAKAAPAAETPAAGAPAEGAPAGGTPATGAATTPATGPAGGPPGSGLPGADKPATPAGDSTEKAVLYPGEENAPPDIQYLIKKEQKNRDQMTQEEIQQLFKWRSENLPKTPSQATDGPGSTGGTPTTGFIERRFVGGPETDPSCPVEPETKNDADKDAEDAAADAAADKAADETAVTDEFEAERSEPTGIANAAEEPMPDGGKKSVTAKSDEQDNDPKSKLRDEYQSWKDGGGDDRRRPLGSAGSDEETATDEEMTVEDSYDRSTLVTAEPYILWTPDKPGQTKIFLKLAWKEEDLTEPRELDVEVRLLDAEVKLGDDFPDVVQEDDTFIVTLDGSTIPSFNKGLFTVNFDINKVGFRSAELGEFFDDATGSSIYFAQPDKTEGKVLIALDTNAELSDLSGAGPLVYLKFKAKADLATQGDAQLSLVTDTAASYILNADGDNVLPVPVVRPVYKTEVVMPPLTEYKRDNTPGQGTPAVPGQPGAPGTPATPGQGSQLPAGGSPGGGANVSQPGGVVVPPPGGGGGGAQPLITAVTPLTAAEGASIAFRATNTGGAAVTWAWSFGGGAIPNSSSSATPTVVTGGKGTYSCSVTATNASGSKTFPFTLTVGGGPQPVSPGGTKPLSGADQTPSIDGAKPNAAESATAPDTGAVGPLPPKPATDDSFVGPLPPKKDKTAGE